MSEPAAESRKIPTVSLKLPRNPSAPASLLLIILSPRESMTEQNPSMNAKLLFSALMTSIDSDVLVELKNELARRFPEN